MDIINNPLFKDDVSKVASQGLPWEKLHDKSILISGATGLIGSFLVDVIMNKNLYDTLNCRIYALGRNEKKAYNRFQLFWNSPLFTFISYDINEKMKCHDFSKVDYVLHLASNTHPMAYATDPIGTITTNVIGLKNMLDFCVDKSVIRFAFASSNEIYGQNRGDVEKFKEDYCGYIDCNTMRAGYPESKRCGEALCQAYIKQKNLDIVIPRLTRSYGPTMLMSDTKAISQFIRKAISDEDIVLKSAGNQYYSYTYVADAVSGLLTVLFLGKSGEAYNISDDASNIRLKDLASLIAGYCNKKVVFEVPKMLEKEGYSLATKALLDNTKIQGLGWRPSYSIKDGIKRTIDILQETRNK
ncbi:NAD-dependent epimerase/dehydratase family protein [Mitsuokella jalaludinii]|uniref:NAD-dependent epimerase/dehydratase family protein n=1 Tax=Mitsuokella jalaludinii TaxID=187979 RepID=UPI00243157DD|nr:NAD-dependent epimerase/dehydratase family protein [Mitsuokella jalaludinii]